MSRTIGQHLDDMIEHGELAVLYLDGRTHAELLADGMRANAVARVVEIMGEACKRLPKDYTAAHPQVPWRLIARIRDILIHHYDGLDWRVIWETVSRHVPAVLAELRTLRSQYDAENPPPAVEPPE
jgi:uncharacterized protein with HEPN domain